MTTQEMIEVLQAHSAGRKIQCRIIGGDEWILCCDDPVWNFSSYEYRVSREPRTFFTPEFADGALGLLHETRDGAIRQAECATGLPYDIVQLIEIVQ